MSKVSVKADVREMEKFLETHGPRAVKRAASKGVNDTLKRIRTKASKGVAQRLGLKVKDTRSNLFINKANENRIRGQVVAVGRALPLKRFKPKQTRKGVSVKIGRGGSRQLVKGAFIVKKLGDHVFKRRGQERLPIVKQYGPAIPTEFMNDELIKAYQEITADGVPKRFEYWMSKELDKIKKR